MNDARGARLADAGEVLVGALRQRPSLVASLLEPLLGVEVGAELRAEPPPAGADLLLAGNEPGWLAIAVLDRRDREARARWPSLLAELSATRGRAGDFLVLTSSRKVARWASRGAGMRGLLGTSLKARPRVLLVGLEAAERLVDAALSDLALVAAWAVHRKHGPRSWAVIKRALLLTDLSGEPWRSVQLHGILRVLHPRFLEEIRTMSPDELPESEAFRRFRDAIADESEARGKAAALVRFLELRGVSLSDEQRAHVLGCRDLPTVDGWVEKVFGAKAQGEMLEALFG